MTQEILHDQRLLWKEKPVLRNIYHDFYGRIIKHCNAGITLEIGGGSGNLKEHLDNVISTDIVHTPWLDAAADAQSLPFRPGSFDNIVAVDVLHHIERCCDFFDEAANTLKKGGRLVLVEPAITPVSWFFYSFFHPEPLDMNVDPFINPPPDPLRKPFDANQAIPTLLFGKYRDRFQHRFPEFQVLETGYFSLFAYPLSGGFRPWCLIPTGAITPLLALENILSPLIGRFMGFRLLIVLEKVR
jgi:SAM-dependent methyltransferase